MLKGIDPILSPDILHALCSMGHGDELVVVDANYPADAAGRASVTGKLLRLDGVALPKALHAILSVFVLDETVEYAVERMEVDQHPEALPQVQKEALAEFALASGKPVRLGSVARFAFYERAKKGYCVILTGETRGWGCFILRKGVQLAADGPAT